MALLDPYGDPNMAAPPIAAPKKPRKLLQTPGTNVSTPVAPVGGSAPATPAIAAPQGTRIGNLTLLPGSGLDNAVKAIGQHQDKVAASYELPAQLRRASTPNFAGIDKEPTGVFARPAMPRPQAPAPQPVVARPSFAGIDAEPTGMFKKPATTPANPAVSPGRTPTANPTSPSYFTGSNGVRRSINLDGTIVGSNPNQVGVGQQSFGTLGKAGAMATESFGGIARPGSQRVASTYGLAVNDPRMDDPTPVIARPGQLTLASPQQVGEYNANKDAREAQTALLSANDSERFRQSLISAHGGRRGREADNNIATLSAQAAGIANQQAAQAGQAIQSRNNNANAFGIADLNNTGENSRNRTSTEAALQVAGMNDSTRREELAQSLIERPVLKQDESGGYLQITGSKSEAVTDSNGNPVRGQIARPDTGLVTPQDQFKAASDAYNAMLKSGPPMTGDPNDTLTYNQNLQDMAARRDSFANNSGGHQGEGQMIVNKETGERRRWNSTTSQWDPADPPAPAVALLKGNPKLAAEFDAKFGKGASTRYLK